MPEQFDRGTLVAIAIMFGCALTLPLVMSEPFGPTGTAQMMQMGWHNLFAALGVAG